MWEILVLILAMIASAVTHERDMYRNLKRCGDAHAWTCKIILSVREENDTHESSL